MRELLETIKILNSKALYLPYHQQRMEKSLISLGINSSLPKTLSTHLTPPQEGEYRCRIIYLKSIISIEYIAYVEHLPRSLNIVESDINYSLKFAQRNRLNELYKQKESADDVLILKNGLITDTTTANIAFYDGSNWYTPTKALLNGTTRARLIDSGFLKVADISPSALNSYSKFALMNSMLGFKEIEHGIISKSKRAIFQMD